MRTINAMLVSVGVTLAAATTAMAAPLALPQDPAAPMRVDVHMSGTHTVWYTSPVWLAIGGIVVLLIIVLAIMAARGRSGTSTTVVR